MYLRRENVTFIEPHMWPINSPDLNPVDCAFALFGVPFNRSTSTIHDNQPAEAAIITEWGKLLQRYIDRAIGQWRRRLEWVVPPAQQGEQI